MERDEFIDFLSEELSEDLDNNRLNRILEAADEYVELALFESMQDNKVNLCDSCQLTTSTCTSYGDDAMFAFDDGKCYIFACKKYKQLKSN